MTEKEHIKLSKLGDHFWLAYSRLIAETLMQVPEHLRESLLVMLQDKSSVYGSVYERYMKGDYDGRQDPHSR